MSISRRDVLWLLSTIPVALRTRVQGPPAARLRRMFNGLSGTYIVEPDGIVKFWTDSQNLKSPFGDDRIIPPYVAEEVPVLKGATTIAAPRARRTP